MSPFVSEGITRDITIWFILALAHEMKCLLNSRYIFHFLGLKGTLGLECEAF